MPAEETALKVCATYCKRQNQAGTEIELSSTVTDKRKSETKEVFQKQSNVLFLRYHDRKILLERIYIYILRSAIFMG